MCTGRVSSGALSLNVNYPFDQWLSWGTSLVRSCHCPSETIHKYHLAFGSIFFCSVRGGNANGQPQGCVGRKFAKKYRVIIIVCNIWRSPCHGIDRSWTSARPLWIFASSYGWWEIFGGEFNLKSRAFRKRVVQFIWLGWPYFVCVWICTAFRCVRSCHNYMKLKVIF